MARKGWEQLTPAYRNRLKRGGINRRAYESGANLGKARGHKEEDRWAEFRRLDGHHVVRGFDQLSVQEKNKVAKWWKQGFMTPGPHNDDQREAREHFENFMREHKQAMDVKGWTLDGKPATAWDVFRHEYTRVFGGG